MLWDPKWQERVTPEVKPLAVWQLKYLAAANDIERHGWVQGRLGAEAGGPRCLIGALLAVDVTDDEALPLVRYLGWRWRLIGTLVIWNDDPMRTKEQVIFALRDCVMSGE
jgi:hypothetical protein